MTCDKCGRKIALPGPFSMHVRFCGKQSRRQPDTAPQKAEPIDVLMKRVDDLERTLLIVGKHLPTAPVGILLTSKNAKSYLTQFKINLETLLGWTTKMIDEVDKQEIADFKKSKGFAE